MPSIKSVSLIPLRTAHCVHKVTFPPAMMAANKSASGAACGKSNSCALPGSANQEASPVSQSEVETPDATAVAATVNACAHLSASSIPAMHLITNPRCAMR